MTISNIVIKKISPAQLFMGSALLVNGGNYLYNLALGRILGPEAFAEAALLITLLLVLSFVGMTFQLVTAKFAVLLSDEDYSHFQNTIYTYSLAFGLAMGVMVIYFAPELQILFQTQNAWMFTIFGVGIPIYFLMSVNRGKYQGFQDFGKLSFTYQTEMWSRLIITVLLLIILPFEPAILVALGIGLSFLFGLIPMDFKEVTIFTKNRLSKANTKKVLQFIGLTAGYELTQIIINNSDILFVKHYFDAMEAGLYASLALIGRVVYFVAWMFVMLLLPKVVQKHKDGEPTVPVLSKYIGFIGMLSLGIVMACYLFPGTIINLLFGEAYLSMAPLLWQYALATSLFAISNIFAYYFLSLDHYIPVILSGILGVSQVLLIVLFHSSLTMIVQIQIIVMVALLVAQALYFFSKSMK
tara:strand:+ start:14668 stop:15903 length:1236 start_codon:yes stop_codon:yes gene_type:complete